MVQYEDLEDLREEFPEYNDAELEVLSDFIDAVVRYVVVTDFDDKIEFDEQD